MVTVGYTSDLIYNLLYVCVSPTYLTIHFVLLAAQTMASCYLSTEEWSFDCFVLSVIILWSVVYCTYKCIESQSLVPSISLNLVLLHVYVFHGRRYCGSKEQVAC